MTKEAFLNARALPSRTRDLALSRQSVYGAALPPLSLRPLSRRSSRIPALLFLRLGNRILNPTSGVGSEFTLSY